MPAYPTGEFASQFQGKLYRGTFTETLEAELVAPSFTSDEADYELDNGAFLEADNWGQLDTSRTDTYNLWPHDKMSMEVHTISVDNDTLKHVYLQDMRGDIAVYGLVDAFSQQVAQPYDEYATEIELTSTQGWPYSGTAYINGEVVTWLQVSDNRLLGVSRGHSNTFAKPADAGDVIYNLTRTQVTTTGSVNSYTNNDGNYITSRMFNEAGKSLTDLTTISNEGIQLQLMHNTREGGALSQIAVNPFTTSTIEDLGEVEEITTPNGERILHVFATDKYYRLTHDRTNVGGVLEEVLLSTETAPGDTSIFVYDSDYDLPDSGFCYMDGEIWYYGSRTSNIVFGNVQRGQMGTTAKVHQYPPAVPGDYTQVYYISDMELNVGVNGVITFVNDGTELIIE